MAFLPASHPKRSAWHLDCTTRPGSAGKKRVPWLNRPWDYWEVWREETVALAIVFQRCAIHAGASPDVFCGAVQELYDCLIPMVEEGDLFNMEKEMWEGVRKDPVAPTSLKRAPSLTPRVEEPTRTTEPNPPPTSKLEGAMSPEDLALVQRRCPLPPPGFLP